VSEQCIRIDNRIWHIVGCIASTFPGWRNIPIRHDNEV
jgi:hypothetical protein